MNQKQPPTSQYPALRIIPSLLLLASLSACGGGGSGSPIVDPGPIGKFTKSITYTGAEDTWKLLDTSATNGRHYQLLYPATDIQGPGNIESISLQFAAESAGNTCPNVVVRMGHTSVASLTDVVFANNVEEGKGSAETVRAAATLTIPTGFPDEYFEISLDKSFAFNGVDNLIVEILTDACLFDNCVVGLAFDPASDTLYGIDIASDQLITIDPTTSFGTAVSMTAELLAGLAYLN